MTIGLLDRMVSLVPSRPAAKAVTGSGYWPSMYPSISRNGSRIMREAQDVYVSNRHVRKAEQVIARRFSTVAWHLEDVDGTAIGNLEGDNNDAKYLAIRDAIERPYRPQPGDPITATPQTRAGLWGLTCRHMGVCGMAFWYLDQTEALAGTPLQYLYINPARMTPAEKGGQLHGWVMDKDLPTQQPFETREVVVFYLEPPDSGFMGTGLVATAMSMVDLSRSADRHAYGVLSSGGRLSGMISGKGDSPIPDEQFDQLVLDLRNVAEDPSSAKRMNVLKGPVEFTRLSATPQELDLVAVMNLARDEVGELWGVPRSQMGGAVPTGLNSGESKGYDEAVLWQNAVGPRLDAFWEVFQYQILDRYKGLGMSLELVIDKPEFDDETPLYERAQKSIEQPLSNMERRQIIGLDPFGDERDDEVWIASTMTRIYPLQEPAPILPMSMLPFTGQAPIEEEPLPEPVEEEPEELPAKARAKVIKGMDAERERQAQRLKADVAKMLASVGADVAAKAEARHGHLVRKPADVRGLFDAARFERELLDVLQPHVAAIAEAAGARVTATLGAGKASTNAVLTRLLKSVGLRIKGMSSTMRDRIRTTVERGIADGLGAAELGKLLQAEGGFDELHAETIARTETAIVLNEASIEQYREFGVSHVKVDDGDEDKPCEEAHDSVWTLEQANADPIAHPNCTRSFTPLVGASA